ncbi:G patch domain-containing protein 1-like isoform X2 [Mercenaria mercenaria]|uniref:G patch domain-containing protein 1-like isoform X2 n=1 Tax=Mercenaria mercenaria TaxID=6596 RepID=UPI00234EC177|nr:G patch domain-containing protein 1-like isoform X2 [Mercenaria mercenaria]
MIDVVLYIEQPDMGEYGIAPRKYVTGSQFTSEERKKRRLVEAQRATSDSIIPGESALLNLIVPERITIGVKLLRKMGWKEGQGVGPRLSRKQKKKSGQKVYGCSMPPSPDSDDGLDDESVLSDVTYAPRDCAQILLSAKDNTHGLGYRGLDPRKALPSSHINLFEAPRVTKGGSSRKGIRGQGFGVGALEEDDDDIYAVDSMSNYDMTMGGEEDDKFGWTGPSGKRQTETPVGYVGKMLDGFTLSAKKLVQKKDFPPPKLPRDFRPVHSFTKQEDSGNILSTQSSAGVDYRQFLKPADATQSTLAGSSQHTIGFSQQIAGPSRQTAGSSTQSREDRNKYKDASARSLALGEKAFVGSVFDLIPQEDKNKMEKVKQGTSQVSGPSTSTALVPSSTDASSLQSTEKPGNIEEQRMKNVPLFQGGFKPFKKDPGKQQRYEKYLEMVKQGHKDPYSAIATSDMTAWEIEHEKEEFHQASKLYRPLAGMMAMRFTRGGNVDDQKEEIKAEKLVDTSDAGKAAAMKMYGKLTREVLEWHPDKLVCKRFNVPNPYPGSTIVGLATVKRDKYSVFNFLNFSNPTQQDQTEVPSQHEQCHSPPQEQSKVSQPESRVDKELNKSKSMKSIFSHLVETEKETQKSTKPVSFSMKPAKSNKPKEFKSIFSHLEKEENTVKSVKDDPVAIETDTQEKDKLQETEKSADRNSDLLIKSSQKKDGEPDMDLYRAIFKNTDSEDSSSSEEEETRKDRSEHTGSKDSSDKMETDAAVDKSSSNVRGIEVQEEPEVGSLPGSGEPMETLSSRLSPQPESDESDAYGPVLPPGPSDEGGGLGSSSAPGHATEYVDLTKSRTPEYIDLTKQSSRKHKHKDKHKHKSKKDKKDKHKKSKHKKKNKKKEKKRNKKQSDSSDSDTTDKDTDDDEDGDEAATDREILNRLKSMKSGQRMRAADSL